MSEILKFGNFYCCYLIEGETGSVLVDTGSLKERNFVLKMIKDKNVKLIVLTHGHIDHIENAAFFSKELNVPIAMHQADLELLADNACRKFYAHSFTGYIMKFFTKQKMKQQFEPFKPTVFLKQSDRLDEYGIDAEIIELPGHTAGSIGIMVDGDKFLVGDAIMSLIVSSIPKIYEDEEKMWASAELIGKSKAIDIYPGHGRIIER